MADALSALILLIYNPNRIFVDLGTDARLPVLDGRGYLIVGKSRFGLAHEEGLGAVQIEWDGKAAWGNESLGWFLLEGYSGGRRLGHS
jgi:hypothetical protein